MSWPSLYSPDGSENPFCFVFKTKRLQRTAGNSFQKKTKDLCTWMLKTRLYFDNFMAKSNQRDKKKGQTVKVHP